MENYDIIIVGGGASGLCAAVESAGAQIGVRVALIEKLPRVGKKLLATGNGRCNLTNTSASAKSYNAPDFAFGAMSRYGAESTVDFFGELGLLTVCDSAGRVYPSSGTAASVLDVLRFEAERLGVVVMCDTTVKSAVYEKGLFLINGALSAKRLVLACGGKASPAHGSDGGGYVLLESFGHSVTPVFPSLVRLRTDTSFVKPLKGIRAAAEIKLEIDGKISDDAEGEILFTENGLSGIAAMEVSRAVPRLKDRQSCFAVLDLLPAFSYDEIFERVRETARRSPNLLVENLLNGILPKRVGMAICSGISGISLSKPASSLGERLIKAVVSEIKAKRIQVTGTNGFGSAQVTSGGAELSEFDCRTLQSRLVGGLFVCGELLDIDGRCGGYNLQWAWASGRLAGKSAAESLLNQKEQYLR
ncbi:MAG: aminoacetone oxidase family FAD-binding enzyme [Clostridiales bacterium]|jgi:predicted Rossmann fold flavoprotein|nr:aminoacetone oxidase family FAD-binding enzyme [Clostridiales bacterium]